MADVTIYEGALDKGLEELSLAQRRFLLLSVTHLIFVDTQSMIWLPIQPLRK